MKCKQNVPCQNEAAEKEQFKRLILSKKNTETSKYLNNCLNTVINQNASLCGSSLHRNLQKKCTAPPLKAQHRPCRKC